MNLFYGADLVENKTFANDLGDLLQDQGYKKRRSYMIKPKDLAEDMRTQFAGDFVNGKFKCEAGVLFIYVSSHGGVAQGGNETYIVNSKHESDKLENFVSWLAGALPVCCTLVFSIDACATGLWWDANINADGTFKPGSSLKNSNAVVVMPEAGALCFQQPVYTRMGNNLDQRRTAMEFCRDMDRMADIRAACNLDANHQGTIVTVPEPNPLLALGAVMPAVVWRRRRAQVRQGKSIR